MTDAGKTPPDQVREIIEFLDSIKQYSVYMPTPNIQVILPFQRHFNHLNTWEAPTPLLLKQKKDSANAHV